MSGTSLIKGHEQPLSLGGFRIAFPVNTRRLIFLSEGKPNTLANNLGNIKLSSSGGEFKLENASLDDPSTIYLIMPIRKPINSEQVPRPNYYPTYAGLSPEQKWIYLNWLQDIKKPINIGYVFIYYYGLERHLIEGEFELAFDEILLLRQYHQNDSFNLYSTSALIHTCLFKHRQDKLEQFFRLHSPEVLENIDLLLAHQLNIGLSAAAFMKTSTRVKGVNRLYIKGNSDIFEKVLTECFMDNFGEPSYPITEKFNLAELPIKRECFLINVSIPDDIKNRELPNFYSHKLFVNDIKKMLGEAHEKTKIILHELRRIKAS